MKLSPYPATAKYSLAQQIDLSNLCQMLQFSQVLHSLIERKALFTVFLCVKKIHMDFDIGPFVTGIMVFLGKFYEGQKRYQNEFLQITGD